MAMTWTKPVFSSLLLALVVLNAVRGDDCPLWCPSDTRQVCGSNGITYPNECVMKRQTCSMRPPVYVMKQGQCTGYEKCPLWCPDDINYVCASNGISYPNECVMKRQTCNSGLEVFAVHPGRCNAQSSSVCPTWCSTNISYVCGSDGITYPSECVMKKQTCNRTGPSVYPVYRYPCRVGLSSCPSFCYPTIDYVCASNGISYTNECVMKKQTCNSSGPTPYVVKRGRCNSGGTIACPTSCPDKPDYVCGTNGITYINECFLRSYNCLTSGLRINIASEGPCPTSDPIKSVCDNLTGCGTNYTLVCGEDGRTYPSHCHLNLINCYRGEIIKTSHDGQC